ncbi:winged helix-turn-helix domain-containing protein [Pseudodonghicola flavimaris]|uniref:Winged helix-turn-helix domain-containing protein n=1 Tax=Pseudodonghicola flavimaris TaxID=3050036 RepID=A0ABT7EWL1_9RHOB|nr:winged helix-turn-helix domain-containing protein [Pseudodonghicola flavimaris]MDK3016732.1 winged helix-turn-helix domain-containing protein [Pseudodonghicola flavimaris]
MDGSRDRETRQHAVLIVETDIASRLALEHLFSVILRQPLRACADCSEAMGLLAEGCRPAMAIVGKCDRAGADLELIACAAAVGVRVIALDWLERPEQAAEAFLAGACDVVRVPFTLKEMALRFRARLVGSPGVGLAGNWSDELDFDADWEAEADIALRAGLTAAEAQVVHILISRSGHIVTRDELSHAIDQRPWAYGDRKFDVHIAKIRKKLTAAFGHRIAVRTERASGYRMTWASDESPASGT